MARSIMQPVKECFTCGTTYNLEEHHVIYGTANRKLSERYGLKVWLCHEHHTGPCGVHFNKPFDIELKKYAQECFEREYGANTSFIKVFGKNYLEDEQ